MSWIPFLVEGLRIWNDASTAKDRAKLEQNNQEAQVQANRAQAVLADNNAQLAEWQAADALYRGGIEAGKVGTRTRMLKGRQVVAAAASGVAIGSGSIQNLLTDTDVLGAEEAATVKFNADRSAWAYRMQALDSRNRAEILRNAKVPVASDPNRAFNAAAIAGVARAYERSER